MAESEAPKSKAEVMRQGAAMLTERLPKGWSSSLTPAGGSIDALLEIRDQAGTSATLIVKAKRIVEGRNIARVSTSTGVSRVPAHTGGSGSYSMPRRTCRARSVPARRSTTCKAMSIPAETPAEAFPQRDENTSSLGVAGALQLL